MFISHQQSRLLSDCFLQWKDFCLVHKHRRLSQQAFSNFAVRYMIVLLCCVVYVLYVLHWMVLPSSTVRNTFM